MLFSLDIDLSFKSPFDMPGHTWLAIQVWLKAKSHNNLFLEILLIQYLGAQWACQGMCDNTKLK